MGRSASLSARPSMADVARVANVSAPTVSRYFTGSGYVSAETRERIAAAVDALGYRVNQAGRNLRLQRTNSVGVLALGALNYGSAGVLTGLSLAARAADYTLNIIELDLDYDAIGWEKEAARALDHFLSMPVDGIVLSTPVRGAEALIDTISRNTPVITVSELPHSRDASASTQSHTAGYEATRHLIALGHERIVHLAGPSTRNEAAERERGYRDAMREVNLAPDVVDVAVDWSSASGFRAGQLVDPATFTGVFAANDEIALGFLSAMEKRGLRAPHDYSIVGVDDMPTAAYFSPPLTTMRLDFRTLGDHTFRMLHHEILTGERPRHLVVEPQLVRRESTALRERS
ncbi:LacI family DNA-binding transcriptional regulator [Microbacterium sp. Bi128]|uniref:LacI family DNA-binding transcriptional regulator n=1 Tax=Microbacterium sp. Bi128 TaxID=2821115 RepID=UPI001D704815|nr:LacI family DNA-binding transcriptional regulator [Microbacterium sp. Bi128]CAH0140395.1 HTH-type transcriptional repressor PurR [Microbacterium sp. Bi128]